MTTSNPSAVFELHAGPFSGGDLAVASFRGREALSRLFSFDVTASTRSDGATLEASLLGQAASLVMHVHGRAPRVVRGIIASVTREGQPGVYGDIGFRVRIVPRLWLLKRRKRSRIFQNQSLVAIVDTVLSEYTIERKWRLSKQARPRTYCVQYQETDYAFVTRLLAEDGIFFSFEHPSRPEASKEGPAEVVVLSDGAGYPAFDASEAGSGRGLTLLYRDSEGLTPGDDFAFEFALWRTVRSNAALLRDFDFQSPARNPTERAAAAGARGAAPMARTESTVSALHPGALEVYEHHGDYLEHDVTAPKAQQVLEQLRRRAIAARGASWCRFLQPGYRFALDEHGVDELNGEYAVTSVVHRGKTPERGAGEGRPVVYRNTFECVPADVPYRPRRPRREIQQVVETATVVGPAGQEIHTDAHGRVKVQFHWDLDGQLDDKSSCWMRVAQAWAGAGWGSQFIPRVGMEVLVTFLGGDTDRPVITGCLYNAHHVLPHSTPTRSGIRTNTTLRGGGFNEVMFEDEAGRELLYLRAQRDLKEEIGYDHMVTVGSRRAEDGSGGNQRILVAQDQTIEIGGSQDQTIHQHQREVIEGNRTAFVRGDDTFTVQGGASGLVAGSVRTRVTENDARFVGGHQFSGVDGSATSVVGGSQRTQIAGDATILVGGDLGATAGQSYSVSAAHTLVLAGGESIRLVCGDSMIELSPDEIVVTAKKMTFVASDAVSVQAPTSSLHLAKDTAVLAGKEKVSLDAKAVHLAAKSCSLALTSDGSKLIGDKVEAFSKGASLQLDSDAALDGGTVKLNCKGDSDSADDPDDPDAMDTSWVEIELLDQLGKPVPGARYVCEASGKKFAGQLGDDGRAHVPIRPGSATISFPDFDGKSWDAA